MAKEERWLSFPLQLSQEVDRLFDEIIHRPWGVARGCRDGTLLLTFMKLQRPSSWKQISLEQRWRT